MANGNQSLPFKQERGLVMDAFVSDEGKYALKAYLSPLIEKIANRYEGKLPHAELVSAGWGNFEKALDKYANGLIEGKTHKFSTYYTWWARQGMARKIADNRSESGDEL